MHCKNIMCYYVMLGNGMERNDNGGTGLMMRRCLWRAAVAVNRFSSSQPQWHSPNDHFSYQGSDVDCETPS